MATAFTGYWLADSRILSVAGKDSRDYLHRVLTCNLKTLKPGQTRNGAMLTGQGKLVAPLRVYAETGDNFTLETPEACAEALQMRLERYIFSEEVTVALTDSVVLDLVGPWSQFAPPPAPGTYRDLEFSVRLSGIGPDHCRLIAPPVPTDLEAPALSEEQYEIWRIERGIPAWGKELDDTLIPLGLGIDDAFDHQKGCYTGQEVISRANFVGHPPSELVGLTALDNLVPGSELTLDGDYVGLITSAAYSASRRMAVALARVRWQKARPGQRLAVGSTAVEVSTLPFS